MRFDNYLNNFSDKKSNQQILENILPVKIPKILWKKITEYARIATECAGHDIECNGFFVADIDDFSGIPKDIVYSSQDVTEVNFSASNLIPTNPNNGKKRKILGQWHSHPGTSTIPSVHDWNNLDTMYRRFGTRNKVYLDEIVSDKKYSVEYNPHEEMIDIKFNDYEGNRIQLPANDMKKETIEDLLKSCKEDSVRSKKVEGVGSFFSMVINQESYLAEEPVKGKDYNIMCAIEDLESTRPGDYLGKRELFDIDMIDLDLDVEIDSGLMRQKVLDCTRYRGEPLREYGKRNGTIKEEDEARQVDEEEPMKNILTYTREYQKLRGDYDRLEKKFDNYVDDTKKNISSLESKIDALMDMIKNKTGAEKITDETEAHAIPELNELADYPEYSDSSESWNSPEYDEDLEEIEYIDEKDDPEDMNRSTGIDRESLFDRFISYVRNKAPKSFLAGAVAAGLIFGSAAETYLDKVPEPQAYEYAIKNGNTSIDKIMMDEIPNSSYAGIYPDSYSVMIKGSKDSLGNIRFELPREDEDSRYELRLYDEYKNTVFKSIGKDRISVPPEYLENKKMKASLSRVTQDAEGVYVRDQSFRNLWVYY